MLTPSGDLSLAGSVVTIMPMPRKLLLILVRFPNQTLSKDELISQLWPDGAEPGLMSQRTAALSLVVHRLRQVFARGPLGRDVIRGVYGKGYRLEACVEACPPERLPSAVIACSSPSSALTLGVRPAKAGQEQSAWLSQRFYAEAHDLWPDRDPSSLPRQQWLMQQCLHHDPSFSQGVLELCSLLLLQCLWGVRSSSSVLPTLEGWLQQGDALPAKAPGWEAIKAEALSLLFWQPQTSDRLYGGWLSSTLPPGPATFSWARHLIFSGRPRQALDLLKSQCLPTLCQGWLLRSLALASLRDLAGAQQAAEHQLSLNAGLVGTRLFLAMLLALKGEPQSATALVEAAQLLEKPFQGALALAAYGLAEGRLRSRAQQWLDEALALLPANPERVGALGYWGLAALALDRSSDAVHLLQLAVQRRCYSAPVLLSTPFLGPYARTPAALVFREAMAGAFVTRP